MKIRTNRSSRWSRLFRCLGLCGLAAMPVACRGRTGPAGPAATADTTQPGAPANLRLETHPAGAPHYLLRWDHATVGVLASMYVVYASRTSSSTIDPADAVAAVGQGLDAAEVTLLGDTGLRYLRVTAVSQSGRESLPSPAFAVDTTGRVLFMAASPGDGITLSDLYSAIPASSAEPTPLNARIGQEIVTSFRASPDGRRVAFLSDRDPGSMQLFVAPIDGSSPPLRVSGAMSPESGVSSFAWAPTADRLAFTAAVEGDGVIEAFVVPADGSTGRVKVSGTMVAGGGIDGDLTAVKWSPNGASVAYIARQRDVGVLELFVAPAAGSAEPVAVSGDLLAGSFVFDFDWSPDGRQLAFLGRRESTVNELFVTSPDGATDPGVRSGAVITGSNVQVARWSPDGSRLAFLANRNGGFQVFVTPAQEAAEPLRLDAAFPPGGLAGSFAWSPDATQIAFVSRRDEESVDELYVATATGGAPAALMSTTSGTVLDFAWSPDGAQLAYRENSFQTQQIELFSTAQGFGGGTFLLSPGPGNAVSFFDWSSEGDRVAFRGAFSVFVANRYGQQTPGPLPGSAGAGDLSIAFPHLGQR